MKPSVFRALVCGISCLLLNHTSVWAQAQAASSVQLEQQAVSNTSELSIFTTPEQRLLLDRLRHNYLATLSRDEMIAALTNPPNLLMPLPELEVFDPMALLESMTKTQPIPQSVQMEMGGVVVHSDGSFTVWLNGVRHSSADLPDSIRVARVKGVTGLQIDLPDTRYFVKPGQQIELLTGEIAESFGASLAPPVSLSQPDIDIDADAAAAALDALRDSEEP